MGDLELLDLPSATAPTPTRFPRRPPLAIDPEAVVQSVHRRAEQIAQDRDRSAWMDARLQRYAKYRGLLPAKTFPWPGCSNVHLPMLQVAELRANAGMHNVVMSLRPLLSAKATSRGHTEQEGAITDLLDAQLFLQPGPELAERRFSDAISAFFQDGNAIWYTPWVRDARTVTTVYQVPVPEGEDPEAVLATFLLGDGMRPGKFPGAQPVAPAAGQAAHTFLFALPVPGRATESLEVRVYTADDAGNLEVVCQRETTVFDGPVALPLSIEQVLVPTRCANLQPPSEFNPEGAPYVFLRQTWRLDDILRAKQSGKFNRLTDAGWATLRDWALGASGTTEAEPRRLAAQKDAAAGVQHETPPVELAEEHGHLLVDLLLCFDRWALGGEGTLAEDVLWMVAERADVLCEARRLSEVYPAVRPYRPLADACALPVPGQFYGISYLELGEALYDLATSTFNQMFDAGTISTLPFFFYGASSKLNTDLIRIGPGEGYPVPGNPRDTLLFPNLPGRDQSWAFQVLGLAMQMFERLLMIGDIQLGRVPTGKASALRTFGTTAALLQQGDVRADQLLLRLFSGLRQIARNFHAMNRHLLPPGTEIRVLGWEGPDQAAYRTIEPEAIDADMDFDFRPDFLNSNGAMLEQALTRMMTTVFTPLGFQLGITSPQHFFNALKDLARASRVDWKRYLQPPPQGSDPPILAEEALNAILADRRPIGPPLEGPEAHLRQLTAFVASPAFGLLAPTQLALFRAWVLEVSQALQAQQTQQAAAQFQQSLTQGPGPGGAPTVLQAPGLGEAMGSPVAPEGTGVGA